VSPQVAYGVGLGASVVGVLAAVGVQSFPWFAGCAAGLVWAICGLHGAARG